MNRRWVSRIVGILGGVILFVSVFSFFNQTSASGECTLARGCLGAPWILIGLVLAGASYGIAWGGPGGKR